MDVVCSWPPHFAHVFLPSMQAVCSSNSDIRREDNCRACDQPRGCALKFLEQMVRLPLALLQQLGSYGTTPGPMLLPTTVQFRPAMGLPERSYSPTYSFPEEIHPCSPQTGNQAQTDEDLSTPPIIGGCAHHSPCKFCTTVRNYCHTPEVTILGKQHFSSL